MEKRNTFNYSRHPNPSNLSAENIQFAEVFSSQQPTNSSFRLENLGSLPSEIRILTAKMSIGSSLLVPEVPSSFQVKVDGNHSRPKVKVATNTESGSATPITYVRTNPVHLGRILARESTSTMSTQPP
ncbi:Uncharacterized protein Fot_00453 [Forsythia ovata]|uniref:Uncharacterized protein n=1 Tax=Forsythia ovata TaxID=205694 RepID=A0ABD1X198_9LAMI